MIRIWASPELHEVLLEAFLDDYGYALIEDELHEILSVEPGPGRYHLWYAQPATYGLDTTVSMHRSSAHSSPRPRPD